MANWIYLTDANTGVKKPVNADLIFTVWRDVSKTVLSTTGDSVFLATESVDVVMGMIENNGQ